MSSESWLTKHINDNLEQLAKTLYDYWFVQFEFPDKDGKPYKSSGGKMIWNEKLKREIPEGWNVKSLYEITTKVTTSINPGITPDKLFSHFSIPAFDKTGGSSLLEFGKDINSNKYYVNASNILVSKLNPWFNRVVYAIEGDNQICSTEFVVIHCEKGIKEYIYMIAKSDPFILYCKAKATGTSNSHKRIDPDLMLKYSVPFDKNTINLLSNILFPMIQKAKKMRAENQELITLRDWLLPMLMNGQIKVSD